MIAGSHFVETGASQPLFAKQGAVQTKSVTAKADIKQYEVVTVVANAAGDGLEAAPTTTAAQTVAVACFAAKAGQPVTVYTQGAFNHEMLVWPTTANTIGKRQALMVESNTITVEQLHV